MPDMEAPRIISVGRPGPAEYFSAEDEGEGLLPWSFVEERMIPARNYWVVSADAKGRPHSMPVWGIWTGKTLQFSTSPQSRKARNLTANPQASVNLEDGDAAVIMEGVVANTSDRGLLEAFVEAYNPKYSWDFTASAVADGGGVFVFTPRKAFAWKGSEAESFGRTATRWMLDPSD